MARLAAEAEVRVLAGDPAAPADPRAGRRVGRRRPVANGRAITGGFVVALAAVVAFGGWLAGRPGRPVGVGVAVGPLAAGTRLTSADLATAPVRSNPAPLGLLPRVELVGRTLAVPVGAGEAVTSSDLVPADATPPLRPVALTVPGPDLADLSRGERVDLLVTSGSAPHVRTTLLLRGGQVMSVSTPSGGLVDSSNGDVVTVGVSDLAEVEAVVAAERTGTVDVVVAEPDDGTGPGAGT